MLQRLRLSAVLERNLSMLHPSLDRQSWRRKIDRAAECISFRMIPLKKLLKACLKTGTA